MQKAKDESVAITSAQSQKPAGFTVRLDAPTHQKFLILEGVFGANVGRRIKHAEAVAMLLEFHERWQPVVAHHEQGNHSLATQAAQKLLKG